MVSSIFMEGWGIYRGWEKEELPNKINWWKVGLHARRSRWGNKIDFEEKGTSVPIILHKRGAVPWKRLSPALQSIPEEKMMMSIWKLSISCF